VAVNKIKHENPLLQTILRILKTKVKCYFKTYLKPLLFTKMREGRLHRPQVCELSMVKFLDFYIRTE